MASIQSLDFTTLVQNMVTSIQARSATLLNLTIGSVLRAIVEAVASVVLWLEAQIAYVLTVTRAATSIGPDLDSFVNDFGIYRLLAVSATGQLTFNRFSNVGTAVIPVNAPVQSQDGTQNFFVTLDTSNPAYSAIAGGYVMNPGENNVTVPAMAVTPGSAGNELANTITVITAPIPGVDTVTNAFAFSNGLDAETDAVLRTRFVLFINSLSKAIKSAIEFAIVSATQGVRYTLTENFTKEGAWNPGFFYAVVDDGTGTPPDSLVTVVSAAIAAVRGFTIQWAVYKPTVETTSISAIVETAPGLIHNNIVANVVLALENFLNNLPLGVGLPYSQIAAIAYGVTGVTNVRNVLLNDGTADVTATASQVLKAGVVAVS